MFDEDVVGFVVFGDEGFVGCASFGVMGSFSVFEGGCMGDVGVFYGVDVYGFAVGVVGPIFTLPNLCPH